MKINQSFWQWFALSLGGLSLVLVIVNAALVIRNQGAQVEVTQRQEVINQRQQIQQLRQVIAQSLANVAISKNDQPVRELMTRHGITINPPAQTAAPAATPAPARPDGGQR